MFQLVIHKLNTNCYYFIRMGLMYIQYNKSNIVFFFLYIFIEIRNIQDITNFGEMNCENIIN